MLSMRIVAILWLVCTGFSANAQLGKEFPQMTGVLLNNKTLNLPFKNNKYSVVAIAFNRSAEDALKKWLNPLYSLFIVKKEGGSNFDMAEIYNVNFVFIPMISGFKKIANDFKSGSDKEFWPYILDTEKTDVLEVQRQLKVSDDKIPYFYVLDRSGNIVDFQSGEYSDEKLEQLEEAVE